MPLNTNQFWSLKKNYYSEVTNAASSYNTYEKFINGVRTDTTIDSFEFESPFHYVPSYGSSINVEFSNNIMNLGDGYVYTSPKLMNNCIIAASLDFEHRTDAEAKNIANYIRATGSHGSFPYQTTKRNGLDSADSYKSIYSIPPYFAHEFRCESLAFAREREDDNSVSMTLVNNNFSEFSIHNLIDIPSLPTSARADIAAARKAEAFTQKPTQAVGGKISMRNSAFGSAQSRTHHGRDGINDEANMYDLSFEGIDNSKLLKLIAFILDKAGSKKFKFTLPPPFSETKTFICQGFNHTYVFKDVHNLSCALIEVH
jgi:phage-related protein